MHGRALLVTTFALSITASMAGAGQHEGQQAAAPAGQAAAELTQCAQAQPLVTGALDAALKRLEDARLSNSPSALRAAADDVESALLDVRARLEPCAKLSAADDAHRGHTMPNVQQAPSAAPATPAMQPGSAAPAPGAVAPRAPAAVGADPHAGHERPPAAPQSAKPPMAPARQPAAAVPPSARPSVSPSPADPHAGHATPPATKPAAPAASRPATPAVTLGALKCPNKVDPKTAPRMLYQGRTYYFCTEGERAEFATDPSKYVTAPAQKPPAHAH